MNEGSTPKALGVKRPSQHLAARLSAVRSCDRARSRARDSNPRARTLTAGDVLQRTYERETMFASLVTDARAKCTRQSRRVHKGALGGCIDPKPSTTPGTPSKGVRQNAEV
jgi:hypothetical protein